MQDLVAVSHTVCAHVQGPAIFFFFWGGGRWDRGVIDAAVTRYSPCKFRRSRSNTLGVGMRYKNYGAAEIPLPGDWGMADSQETRSYATCAIVPNLVALDQTVWP